ncbi:MAG TPA: peptide deformylase [Ruminococcaceae bacterium]|nr:peptide deformylase [Oscillospiraceae bacterium]HCT17088.1 peptide deformylase [Oscillospiraceae bacterium]
MVKELIHDPILLAAKSTDATADDLSTAEDLLDTLRAHSETCVGMAANMIGVRKRIICFTDGKEYITMLNPEIIKKSDPFETEEGCLSLLGGPRKCKRYKKIKVRFQNARLETRLKTYIGFTAQIIQHEVDHCNGILI